MNAFFAPGAKRNRLLIAFGLALLLASPLMLLWASKEESSSQLITGDSAVMQQLAEKNANLYDGMVLPAGYERPVAHSPFGDRFTTPRFKEGQARGLLATPLGHLDPRNPQALLRDVPPELLYHANEITRVARGEIVAGLDYVMLSPQAVASRPLEEVHAGIAKDARIIGYLPENTLLVQVDASRLSALGKNPDVAFIQPYHPAFKIALDFGRRPMIEKARATRDDLQMEVYSVPGADAKGLERALEQIAGVKDVKAFGADGSGFAVLAHYSAAAKIARLEQVLHVKEGTEFMENNAKNVPTMQAGSWEDTLGIRPFDVAGADGGGIAGPSGQRVNDGTAPVPPQIVGVTDNGISYDTPSFSQSATQPTDFTHPIGPSHRKVHAIQNLGDSGNTCDGTLSGAGTHGNIVASAIGAYASQLGFFLTRAGIGGAGQPRGENLDGVARGARIIMQDAADVFRCNVNSLVERGGNVAPGRLLDDMNKLICPKSGGIGRLCTGETGGGTEVHLAVLPFGAPDNFSNVRFPASNGTYPQEAADLDVFLYNNRDFMIVSPVGNSGGILGGSRVQLATPTLPDLFDGTAADDDPNLPQPVQIQPPSTAKNIVSVGSGRADDVTFFGTFDTENTHDNYASRGPAGGVSVLRTAPILQAPASDLVTGTIVSEVAGFRSRDNDNLAPVDAQLDSGNFGTSFAAAYVTGAAAIVRDYFAQGFYPTGDRNGGDRVANVSGALVKASLIASAKFMSNVVTTGQRNGPESLDAQVRRTRSMNLGGGIGVFGNNEQGYGRVVLTQVLPLANWSRTFALEPNSVVGPQGTIEHPAAALLAWDDIATGELLVNNTTHTSAQHLFRLASPDTSDTNGPGTAGGVIVNNSELRIGLAWPDVPSPAGSGGPLVNDLDLILEGPGPDNCLFDGDTRPDGTACPASGSAADNQFFDGNVYHGGRVNSINDQWSLARTQTTTEVHDTRNPQEGIHLSSRYSDTPIYAGTYRVTVQRGTTGFCSNDPSRICANNTMCASPGTCTPNRQISGIAPTSEDANGNRRLDPGLCSNSSTTPCFINSDCVSPGTCQGTEDLNQNGLLDLDGQAYALVVAGPVFLAEAAPLRGPTQYPQANITFDKVRYSCSDAAVADIYDASTGAGTSRSQASTTFQVLNSQGTVVDSESNIAFTPGPTPGASISVGVPVRLASPAIPNDGVLEVDTNQTIAAIYAPAGQRAVTAKAQAQCSPDFINAFFLVDGNNAIGDQVAVGAGCDDDEFLDAGETVTYGVALINRSRTDVYKDVTATLTPSGTGAAAIRVLDSPRSLGTLPGSGSDGVFFHVFVDGTKIPTNIADRKVTMTLTLDASSKGLRLGRQSYSFTHAINADRDTKHYSTDFPAGGREVRDLNRNLVIDQPDVVDPFKLLVLPDEDVTFSTLFVPGDASGRVTNTLGEDLNGNGILDPGEDVIPNNVLDPGLLASSTGPTPGVDRVPWNFDQNNGGWVGIRHPQSTAAQVVNEVWEYKTAGLCGFQTAGGAGKFGIWHTGDGDPTTPSATATACDNYPLPIDLTTARRAELYFDVLHSPIIAKVNQVNDARGFPYTVEFQRFAANFNMQTFDAYAGGGVNIDNDIDSDVANCMLCQEMDIYYTRRFGGWPYDVFRFAGQSFGGGGGIDPLSYNPYQRTFGPYQNPDGHALNGDESGFTGSTQNTNPDSVSPIPTAAPDFLPFPLPGAPVPGVCTAGTNPGAPCQPGHQRCSNDINRTCTSSTDCVSPGVCQPDCAGGGTCMLESNTLAGPVRNFETTLIGYEGGFSAPENGIASNETGQFFIPGHGGNRWEIGIGFFAIESVSNVADYGFGVDDVVFEWDETHPLDESQFSPAHLPACSRFGQPGQPGGGQCATVTADRTFLYECEESVEITVFDPKRTLDPSVQVSVVTDSDSVHVVTQRFAVNQPNSKSYTLTAVPGSPGLYKGTVTFSSQANNPTNVFTNPGTDSLFTVYYVDPQCDGDGDGQVGEVAFNNLDGDGIADDGDGSGVAGDHPCAGGNTVNCDDNCPLVYNPTQADADGDGVGDLCDNCPGVFQHVCSNNRSVACTTSADCVFPPPLGSGTCVIDQTDGNADGVGDVCEYDDLDGDGVANSTDNCPDVYNPDQALGPGSTTRGAVCSGNGDLDSDGVADRLDNCVLTYNPAQTNSDHASEVTVGNAGIGDACDGDCPNISVVHICSNSPATACTSNAGCPTGGTCQTEVRHTAGTCSLVDDDADADGVEDSLDNCPAVFNPPIIPGTKRQLDSDRDGLGDACDPPQSLDDNFDGIPDDLPSFTGRITCKIQTLALAKFAVVGAFYKDANGDQDAFPDPGEYGRVKVVLKNTGPALTGATFHMTSGDPDVACINSPTVVVGAIPAGGTVTLSDFDPTKPIDTTVPGLFFTTSPTILSQAGLAPAKVTLCLTVTSNEALGSAAPICFNLQGDLDLPTGATQTFTAGPPGGSPGTLFENFDVDADGDTNFTVKDTFYHQGQTGIDASAHGFYIHSTDTPVAGTDPFAGVACGGFSDVAAGNLGCRLNPAFPMDWHFHCKPGATNCPNTESGTTTGTCATPNGALCSYNTPTNGQRAFSVTGTSANSLHLGIHTDAADSLLGDTVHLRTLAAFSTPPINLAILPRAGDLQMTFYQIADFCTGGGKCVSGPELGYDNGDVQIRLDKNPDPNVDDWGFWDKLVPFENVYDHKGGAWSAFTPLGYYCNFTPADTGGASPSPRGVHETMCFPLGVWSKCGSIRGTSTAITRDCAGPGALDPSGHGVWVQSKFNLAEFLGQRVEIRWIGQTWMFDSVTDDYTVAGGGFATSLDNDGWWIDDIFITGTVTTQVAPVPDRKTPPAVNCNAPGVTEACNSTVAGSDRGTSVVLQVVDVKSTPIDGVTNVAIAGQALRITAVNSTIPGGCVNGAAQFQFFKNGVVAQDWSSKTYLEDSPEADASYSAKERCSADFNCTSQNAVGASVQVYRGDGSDIALTVTHSAGTTTLSWLSRPQAPPLTGYDVFRGTLPPPDPSLGTLTRLSCDVAQALPLGSTLTRVDPTAPPASGSAYYYLVGHSNPTAGIKTNLGTRSDGTEEVSPISCP